MTNALNHRKLIAVMKTNNKQKQAVKAIEESKGRFFGLYTKKGQVMNAQLVGSTPCYLRVYDRNSGIRSQIAKTSVASVKLGSKTFG